MTEHKKLPKFGENSYVHFVTTATFENLPYFRNEECCRVLLEEMKFYRDKFDFTLPGYVIMPDHIHLLLWWDKTEKPNLSISDIMRSIKGAAARRIINSTILGMLEHPLQLRSASIPKNPKSHIRNIKYRLWRRGFYDFNIYTQEKLVEKLNYMHNNPVKARLVSSPCDYRWSSYSLYLEIQGSSGSTRGADAPRYPMEERNNA